MVRLPPATGEIWRLSLEMIVSVLPDCKYPGTVHSDHLFQRHRAGSDSGFTLIDVVCIHRVLPKGVQNYIVWRINSSQVMVL